MGGGLKVLREQKRSPDASVQGDFQLWNIQHRGNGGIEFVLCVKVNFSSLHSKSFVVSAPPCTTSFRTHATHLLNQCQRLLQKSDPLIFSQLYIARQFCGYDQYFRISAAIADNAMADHPEYILQVQQQLERLQADQQALRERQAEVERQIEAERKAEDDFRSRQKLQAFQFAKFRTEGRRLTVEEVEGEKFKTLKLPKRGRYRGPGMLAGKWKGFRFSWDADDIGHHGSSTQAKRARIRIQRRLKAHKFHLERTLGWGGHGIASLYRFRRGPDHTVEYVVVKCHIDQDNKLKETSLIRERKVQEVGT
jgi:cell division protein FtsB